MLALNKEQKTAFHDSVREALADINWWPLFDEWLEAAFTENNTSATLDVGCEKPSVVINIANSDSVFLCVPLGIEIVNRMDGYGFDDLEQQLTMTNVLINNLTNQRNQLAQYIEHRRANPQYVGDPGYKPKPKAIK